MWLKEWWRRYDVPLWSQRPDGTFRLDGFDVTQSWDCAFRDTKSSDYVVGQVWAKRGADSYLVYELWRRLSFTQTLDAVRHLTWMFPQSRRKIIEGKANGDAVIDSLHHEIPGIVVFEPGRDSKEGRARRPGRRGQPVPRRDLPHWRGGVDHRPHRKDPALQRQATGTTSARSVPTTHQ